MLLFAILLFSLEKTRIKHKCHKFVLLNITFQKCERTPVFGTEEALVEPMLLALDTIVPFLVVSAKKTIKEKRLTSVISQSN